MSSAGAGLDRSDARILLACLEARRPVCSAAALERFPHAAAAMKAAGLLKPAGHEAVAGDDDSPRQLTWSAEAGGYGYFSETKGWSPVADEHIQSFSVDLVALIAAMTAKLSFAKSTGLQALVKDYLWEIGDVRLDGRHRRMIPLLFGRRLHNAKVWGSAEKALLTRPSEQRRVLLTSTAPQLWPKGPAICQFLSAEALLDNDGGLTINPARLTAGLQSTAHSEDNEILRVIGDGKEVRFKGETYLIKKGVEQRRVICFLRDRYLAGQRWTSSEEIIEELDLRVVRIRDLFKGSPLWNRLLTEKSGMCGFCFNVDPK